MITLSIVVEGQSDEVVLRRLSEQLSNCELRFYVSGGRVALATIGRNLLVHQGGSLLIVMDSDTLNPSKAEEERGMARFLLQRFSEPDNCDAFAFVPEMEVLFFEAPAVLIGRLGAKVVTEAVIERGHYLPKDTLGKVLSPSGLGKEEFFKSLTSAEMEALRQGPQARKLIATMERLVASAARFEAVEMASPQP
jgi:hypothetical protein